MGLPLKESVLQARRLPRNDDLLMERAKLLSREDMELMEAVFVRGQSTRSIARMLGVDVRLLRNRVGRLAKRLASRKFLDAARSLPYLADADAKLARLRYCQGRTLRQLQAHFNVTDHTIRRWLDHVAAQVSMVQRLARQTQQSAADAYDRYWSSSPQDT